MASLPPQEVSSVLRDGERLIACVPADGVFARKHDFYPSSPHVLVTDSRIAFLSRKGMLTKRLSEHVSWPLTSFTSRLNFSEGSALGPFMHFVTLFTHDDESVSAAFKSPDDREAYKRLVVEALAPVSG